MGGFDERLKLGGEWGELEEFIRKWESKLLGISIM